MKRVPGQEVCPQRREGCTRPLRQVGVQLRETGIQLQPLDGTVPTEITFSISCLSFQTETSVAQPQALVMSFFPLFSGLLSTVSFSPTLARLGSLCVS